MRGGDQLGRFSGNKFGVILNNCTPDDMEKAAERLVTGVPMTSFAPARVRSPLQTVGGVTAPRHASNAGTAGACAGDARPRQPSASVRTRSIGPISNARHCGDNVRAADEIVTALNERRIPLAFEPVVETISRRIAFHECLMRIRRADGRWWQRAGGSDRRAFGLSPARSPH
jgi:hypothetical protein